MFLSKRSTFLYIGLTFAYFRLSGKDPVFNALFTHTQNKTISWSFTRRFFNVWINYDSFYGLCRYTVKQTFAFNFEFFFVAFILWWKGNFSIMELILSFPNWSIFGPTKEIWRVCSWSEMFIENWSNILLFWLKFILFKQHYIFLYITIFIWEVRFTCFPKWFGITINTKFLKVL